MKIMERARLQFQRNLESVWTKSETELDFVPLEESILIIKAKTKKSPLERYMGS